MLIIDAHVHIYSCFDLKVFFNAASKNFHHVAESYPSKDRPMSILILTDWSGENWFNHLVNLNNHGPQRSKASIKSWSVQQTSDPCAIYIEHTEKRKICIIAGRKIITAENLEVLAIASHHPFKDGLTLRNTIDDIKTHGAIPVIPWAVGKWLGNRGKLLTDLINDTQKADFFLCDNGNRPIFWPRPSHFSLAENNNIRIMAGSDPLHFPSASKRPGSFGFMLNGSLCSDKPSVDLKRLISDPSVQFKCYGDLESPLNFFRSQITMQLFKKKWRNELTG